MARGKGPGGQSREHGQGQRDHLLSSQLARPALCTFCVRGQQGKGQGHQPRSQPTRRGTMVAGTRAWQVPGQGGCTLSSPRGGQGTGCWELAWMRPPQRRGTEGWAQAELRGSEERLARSVSKTTEERPCEGWPVTGQ